MGGASKVIQEKQGVSQQDRSDLSKDEHPRAEKRAMVGSKSGTTPKTENYCAGLRSRGRSSCALPLGEGRRRERDGTFGSYFREAPHGVMQTHAQPPRASRAQAYPSCHWRQGERGREGERLGCRPHKTIPKGVGSLAPWTVDRGPWTVDRGSLPRVSPPTVSDRGVGGGRGIGC